MTKLWRRDMMICGTVYIKADTAAEAERIAQAMKDTSMEISEVNGDHEVSGLQFDNPALPDVSFTPPCNIIRPVEGGAPEEVE
jgi:hypothetical protein